MTPRPPAPDAVPLYQGSIATLEDMARSLITASVVHATDEPILLPLTPARARQLGRAIEAVAGFEAHRRKSEAAGKAVLAEITAGRADAMARLEAAGREFRRAIVLNLAVIGWLVAVLVAGWLG